MAVRVVDTRQSGSRRSIQAFLDRPAFSEAAEKAAARALGAVRREGMPAVLRCARRFDGVSLKSSELRVPQAEIDAALKSLGRSELRALRAADRRVAAFARAGIKKNWTVKTPHGGTLGERFTPLDRVGVYVPGGEAPLVSTVIMTATLARVAGVKDIVACTPCGADKQVNPMILAAMKVAGVHEVYRVGGIQAIGLMAYGVEGIAKVQKIVGPGGPFVTAAKRQVYGHVSLDLVAGPSEIAILADSSARAGHVAADLLSQAEHGTGWEKALLVTTSRRLAGDVARAVERQAAELPRQPGIRTVMSKGMLIVTVADLDEGMALCNAFAPEHFELMVRSPMAWAKKATHAGAVFVGPWTPESAGDFVAGPSHVLPTGGAAALFSGLTVDDFLRRTSVVAFKKADLEETLPVIEMFGKMEGLEAHARSARIRFE